MTLTPVMSPRGARLLFVVNVSWFFISHRLQLAVQATRAGYDVHIATEICSEEDAAVIRSAGLTLHDVRIGRSGSHPWRDIKALLALWQLLWQLKPDLVHLVGMKALLVGGLAARLSRVPGVVMAITGLGHAFVGHGVWARLRSALIGTALRVIVGQSRCAAIFQNVEDRNAFLERGIVPAEAAHLIRGSGVDLERFTYIPESAGPLRVLLASRMLRTKGVPDFVAAAKQLREHWSDVQFLLAGNPDPGNPASLTEQELAGWSDEGAVTWLGHQNDLAALLATVHIVALPTYYKEGVPKILIEAAACGRPIVTTNVPGCNDIVRHGVNGLLVPPQDPLALAAALDLLLKDSALRVRMGEQGRKIAVSEFGLEQVIDSTLGIYELLMNELETGVPDM